MSVAILDSSEYTTFDIESTAVQLHYPTTTKMGSLICPPGPLAGLPAELYDYRRGQMTLVSSEYSEGRPFFLNLLEQGCLVRKNDIASSIRAYILSSVLMQLDPKDIWKHIFPYRHVKLMCQSTSNPCEVVYDFFLSSLQSWFSSNRLTPLNFTLWSVSMLLTIMRDLSKDLEARRIYFRLLTEDMSDLFRAASPRQMNQLANRLIMEDPNESITAFASAHSC